MQGRVTFVNEKPWNGKTLYSFKLANDEALYMCGTDKPSIAKGDFIEFDAELNPRGQSLVKTKSIKKKESEVVTPSSGAGREAYWQDKAKSDDTRQSKIEWQAARNSAIAAADVILKNGALKLPAKENAKYDAVMALIGDLTSVFFEQTKTLSTAKQEPKAPISMEAEVEIAEAAGDGGWDE